MFPKEKPIRLHGAALRELRQTGEPHVFSRIDGQRTPWIKYGLSVPQMLGNENVKQATEVQATAFLKERLDHEIDVILRGVVK